MILRHTLIIIIAALQVVGCAEQVDINEYIQGKESNRLVVEGLITNEYKRHAVKLSRTGAVLTNTYEPVTGAGVAITDGNNIFVLQEDTAGVYLTDSLQGSIGQRYTLTITVDVTTYSATDEMVAPDAFGRADGIALSINNPPHGYIQSPLIVFGSNQPSVLNIAVNNPRPSDKYTNFTYYAFPGIHPDHLLPKYVEATLQFDEGTEITQTKYSMSEGYYEFTRAVLLETEYNGGVFGSVRADVPTNISNGALGFFAASAVAQRTGVIGPDGRFK